MWGNSLADGGFLNSFIQSFCHHICKCNFSSICEVCGHSGVMNTTVRRKKVLVVQSCLILCDPMDCSPPGSSVPGILQARILIPYSFPPVGDLPTPGIKPRSPALQADSLPAELPGKPKTSQSPPLRSSHRPLFQAVVLILCYMLEPPECCY